MTGGKAAADPVIAQGSSSYRYPTPKGEKTIMTDPIAIVEQFIVEHFLFGDSADLDRRTSFLESGVIDSTGLLELVSFLEETFAIAIEDDELVPENLDSLDNLARFLAHKLNGDQ